MSSAYVDAGMLSLANKESMNMVNIVHTKEDP